MSLVSTHQIPQCNVGYTVQIPTEEMPGHLQQLLRSLYAN